MQRLEQAPDASLRATIFIDRRLREPKDHYTKALPYPPNSKVVTLDM